MSKPTIHPPLAAAAWPVVREWAALDDLCTGVFDCPHTTPQLTDDGPFVVRSQDVRSGVFRLEEAGRVSAATYRERIARAEPTFGDILYSREGTYFGNAAEVPAGVQVCLGQRMVLIKPRREAVDSRFLTFWLNSPVLKEHILGFRDGSVAERLNMPTIRNIPVPLVPISEQKRIGEALGALNDKIELNRRINETLEAMAQAIFRDWFVAFGPVRRKLAGETDPVTIMGGLTRDPARATELAALFPTALGEDDLPVGWAESTLGEKTMAVLGGTPSRKVAEYWGGSVPWINSGAVNEFRITQPSELITEQGLSKSAAKLLPRRTTVLAITGATLGQVSLTEIETSANQSVVGLVPNGGLPPEFVYLWVMETIDEIVARQTGGAQQHINKGNVEEQRVLSPPRDILDAWSGLAVPLFDRIASGCLESHTLVETRDYLLPRLMSGVVRVGATAELAKEVAA